MPILREEDVEKYLDDIDSGSDVSDESDLSFGDETIVPMDIMDDVSGDLEEEAEDEMGAEMDPPPLAGDGEPPGTPIQEPPISNIEPVPAKKFGILIMMGKNS